MPFRRFSISRAALALSLAIAAQACSDGERQITPTAQQALAPSQTVSFISAGASMGEVDIAWESVAGATRYEVNRCTLGSAASCDDLDRSTCSPIGQTAATIFTDATAATGVGYCYAVAACNDDVCSSNLSPLRASGVDPTAALTPDVTITGADAGFAGQFVTIHARTLNAPAGASVDYRWTTGAAVDAVITNAHRPSATIKLPFVATATDLTVNLSATFTDTGEVITETKTITVNPDDIILTITEEQVTSDGSPVRLHASAVTDSGAPVTYSWAQLSPDPTMTSAATLTEADTANPLVTLTPTGNLSDTFRFEVTAVDTATGDSARATAAITVSRPRASLDLGNDVQVHAGETVSIIARATSGRAPFDIDFRSENAAVTPAPASAQSPDGDAVVATFTAPEVTSPTTIRIFSNMTDANLLTASDEKIVTVVPAPAAFTLQAQPAITVAEGDHVNLLASVAGGTGATTFTWSQTGGAPTVTLSGETTANATFQAPDVASDTTLTFEVGATNGSTTLTETISVTITDIPKPISNVPPGGGAGNPTIAGSGATTPLVAHAGPNDTALGGDVVTLHASADGGAPPYVLTWRQLSGPAVTLAPDTASDVVTFIAPALGARDTLIFEASYVDGAGAVSVATAAIAVEATVKPLVALSPNATAIQNEPTQLAAFASGGAAPYSYAWTVVSGGASLTNASTATPTLTGGTVQQVALNLAVTDSAATTINERVVVNVIEGPATAPLFGDIRAQNDVLFSGGGTSLVLDITGGVAPYAVTWGLASGSDPVIVSPDPNDNQKASVQAPTVSSPNFFADIEATIGDANGNTFVADLRLPILQISGPFSIQVSESIGVLEGGAATPFATPNGGVPPYTYSWRQETGTPASLSGVDKQALAIIAPDVAAPSESLRFSVAVTDATGAMRTADVNLLVADITPPATPSPAALEIIHPFILNVSSGAQYTLNSVVFGGAPPYTYRWEGLAQIGNPSVPAGQETMAALSLTAPSVTSGQRTLGYRLTATDSLGKSVSDIRIVNVSPMPSLTPFTVAAAVDSAHRSGEDVHLSATSAGGVDPVQYSWTPVAASGLSVQKGKNPVFTAPVVTAANTFKYSVTATDATGRKATDTVAIKINPSGPAGLVTSSGATIPNGLKAWNCSGPLCGLFPGAPGTTQVTCRPSAPVPMVFVKNESNGNKSFTQRCASITEAETEWWQQSSDRTECTDFDARQSYMFAFQCSYACVTDFCNGGPNGATYNLDSTQPNAITSYEGKN